MEPDIRSRIQDAQSVRTGALWVLQFALRRIARGLLVLLGTTVIIFLLMHAIPGNPWSNYSSSPRMILNLGSDASLQRELNRRFGLNLPLWRQFTRYLIGDMDSQGQFFCGVVCGNLGPSIQRRGVSVRDVLFSPSPGKGFWQSRFGYSVRMVLFAALLAVGPGILLGILSAVRPRSAFSRAVSVGLAAVVSIPNFILGLLAIIVAASWLKIINVLPDWNVPGHWIIPGLVLAAMPMANLARVTRAAYIHTLGEDYVRTARAKGLSRSRVLMVHVLRNAAVPIITYLGPTLMELFTGLLIVENLFAFPGIGRQFWEAVLNLDYPMIMGLTLLYATGMVLVTGGAEIASDILDPRLRQARQEGAR